jgi:hypothetical protein
MRIVIVSDLHVGSESGLTPFPTNKTQGQLYNRWADCIGHFGARPDLLIANGDCVDGTQEKGAGSGDSDWIASQIDRAASLIAEWRPKCICIVGGTHYHTSAARGRVDFEEILAGRLRAGKFPGTTFHRKLNLEVAGWWRGQFRHKIGSSSVPYGAATAPSRSKIWGVINAYGDGKKAPHLSVFSHTHRWNYSEDAFGATMITPAWQAIGSDHGDRACDGHVDLGAVQLTIGKTEAEGWSWKKRLYPAAVADRTVRL